jgi:hypothetical protein
MDVCSVVNSSAALFVRELPSVEAVVHSIKAARKVSLGVVVVVVRVMGTTLLQSFVFVSDVRWGSVGLANSARAR